MEHSSGTRQVFLIIEVHNKCHLSKIKVEKEFLFFIYKKSIGSL